KAGIAPKEAERVRDIAADVVDPAEGVGVTRLFHRQGGIAEAREGQATSFLAGHAHPDVLVRPLGYVESTFFVERAFSVRDSVAQAPKPSHDSLLREAQHLADRLRQPIPSGLLFVETLLPRARQFVEAGAAAGCSPFSF